MNLLLTTSSNISNKIFPHADAPDFVIFVGIGIGIMVVGLMFFWVFYSNKVNKEEDEESSLPAVQENTLTTQNFVEEETYEDKKELSDIDVENLRKSKALLDDGVITREEFDKLKKQTLGLGTQKKKVIKCPHCGGTDCQIVSEVKSSGKDYEADKGCCGFILLGPIGLLCGACGDGQETTTTHYWVCKSCGHKWKV